MTRVGCRTGPDFTLRVSLRQDFSCLDLNQPSGAFRCRFNVPDGWVHLRWQLFDVRRLICLGSHGKLLTHPHFPQLSRFCHHCRCDSSQFPPLLARGEVVNSEPLLSRESESSDKLFRQAETTGGVSSASGNWTENQRRRGVCGSVENTAKNWHPMKNAERDTLGVFCKLG